MSGYAPGSRAARLAMQSGNVRMAESDSDTDSVSSGGTAISNTLVATDSEEEAVGYDAVRAAAAACVCDRRGVRVVVPLCSCMHVCVRACGTGQGTGTAYGGDKLRWPQPGRHVATDAEPAQPPPHHDSRHGPACRAGDAGHRRVRDRQGVVAR